MQVGIMQPYLFPYIGYFQLMNAVDEFIIYDNIEFTKKGWINRNRILVNGKDDYITFPLKKDSDYLHVNQRFLADNWEAEKKKIINRISGSYRKAPYFKDVFPFIEESMEYPEQNLFGFIYQTIFKIKNYLDIPCSLIISSEVAIDHSLKAEKKVLALCKERNATGYINLAGGVDLYNKETFAEAGIELKFIKMEPFSYKQFENEFVPSLSVIDVLMFNAKDSVKEFLNNGYILF